MLQPDCSMDANLRLIYQLNTDQWIHIILMMTQLLKCPYHLSTVLVTMFGQSLTPILNGCQARSSKSCQTKAITSDWWMVAYFAEMSIMSPSNDRVLNSQMCHNCHHPNDHNSNPTIIDWGKVTSQINIIEFLIHVFRINMVTDMHLSWL